LLQKDGLNVRWYCGVKSDYEEDLGQHSANDAASNQMNVNADLSQFGYESQGGRLVLQEETAAYSDSIVDAMESTVVLHHVPHVTAIRSLSLPVFQRTLIVHFNYLWNRGQISWPSRTGEGRPYGWDDSNWNSDLRRLACLYKKQSTMLVRPKNSSADADYTVTPGFGLFSSATLRKDIAVAEFIGEFVSYDEFTRRAEAGCGSYGIKYSEDEIYDCYNTRDICLASMANTARNGKMQGTNSDAKNNCKIRIDVNHRKIRLCTTCTINSGVELLLPYSGSYQI
jgi:hypothetical protein